MDFLSNNLLAYLESHTSPESEILKELNRETKANVLMPRMLSGHLQGRFLAMLSKMIQPKNILEIGTYTGYSALCLAEGLSENGILHTIDLNEELEDLCKIYFEKAGFQDKIKVYIGKALEIIPGLKLNFDLVFIDADKINYSNYYDLVFDKIPSGGYILADNVLWSGKVLSSIPKTDKDTLAIHNFNQKVQADSRVENILIPIRDGLMLLRKK